MKMTRLAAFFLMLSVSCFAAVAESRLHFPVNGYSIAPLEGTSDAVPSQSLIMFLPPKDGFSPNVNVQIQPYNGSIKDFADLSDQQFKSMGFKVLNREATATAITWEYQGPFQGQIMHWFSRAIQSKGRFYVVTATALESQWADVAGQLKACVNSFKLDADVPHGKAKN